MLVIHFLSLAFYQQSTQALQATVPECTLFNKCRFFKQPSVTLCTCVTKKNSPAIDVERRLSRLTRALAMNIVSSSVIAVKTLGGVEHLVCLVYDDYIIALDIFVIQFDTFSGRPAGKNSFSPFFKTITRCSNV